MLKKIITGFLTIVLMLTVTPANNVMAEEDLHAKLSNEMVLTWSPYEGANFDHYEIEIRTGSTLLTVISGLTNQSMNSFDLKTDSDVQTNLSTLYGTSSRYYKATVIAYSATSYALGSSWDEKAFFENGHAIPPYPTNVTWTGNSTDGYGVSWTFEEDDLEYITNNDISTDIYLHDVTGGDDRVIVGIGGTFSTHSYSFGNVFVPGRSYRVEILTHISVSSGYVLSESAYTPSILTMEGTFDPSDIDINARIDSSGKVVWDYENQPGYIMNVRIDYFKEDTRIFREYKQVYQRKSNELLSLVRNHGAGTYTVEVTPGTGNSDSTFITLGGLQSITRTYSAPRALAAPTDIILQNGNIILDGAIDADIGYIYRVYKYDENYPQHYNPWDCVVASSGSSAVFSLVDYYKYGYIELGDRLVIEGSFYSDSVEYTDSPATTAELYFYLYEVDDIEVQFNKKLRAGGHLPSMSAQVVDYSISSLSSPTNFEIEAHRCYVEYSSSGLSGTWSQLSSGNTLYDGYYRYRISIRESSDDVLTNPWITPDATVTCGNMNFHHDGEWNVYPYSQASYLELVSDSFYLAKEKVTGIDVRLSGGLDTNDILPEVTTASEITGSIESAILTTEDGTYNLTDEADIYITNEYSSVVAPEETLMFNKPYTLWVVIHDDCETIWNSADITRSGVIADWYQDSFHMASVSDYIFTKQFKTPVKVKELTAGSRSANAIELCWDSFADTYEIYRSENGENGVYVYKNTTSSDSFIDDTVVPAKTYTYKIRGIADGVTTDYTNAVTVVALPENITGLTVTNINHNDVSLTWDAGNGTGYKLYKSTKVDGSYSAVTTINNPAQTSANVLKLKENTELFYKVTSIAKIGSKTYESPLSEATPVSAKTLLAPPVLKSTVGHETVTVTWKKINNAKYYSVERSKNGSSFEYLYNELDALTFTDSHLENDSEYTYRITAFSDDNLSNSVTVTLTPKLGTVKIKKAYPEYSSTNRVYLDLDLLDDVNEYEAYVSTNSRGPFAIVESDKVYVRLNHLEVDYNFDYGKTYYVKVAPVQNGITGTASNAISVKMSLNAPKITQTYDNNGRVNTVMDFNGTLPNYYVLEYSTDKVAWNTVCSGYNVNNMQMENYNYVNMSEQNFYRLTVTDGNGLTKTSAIKKVSYSVPSPTLTLTQEGVAGVRLAVKVNGDNFEQYIYRANSTAELKTKMAIGEDASIGRQYGNDYSLYYSDHDIGSTYYYAVVLTDSLGKSKTVTKSIKITAAAPSITKAVVSDAEEVELTIKKVPYTNWYRVLTSEDNKTYTNGWEGSLTSDVQTIKLYGKIGTKRYYKVEPVVAGYILPVSAVKSVSGTVKAPTIKTLVVTAPGEVKVTITPSKGEPFRYDVYRKDSTGSETLIRQLYYDNEFVDHIENYNGTYSYRVLAYYPSGTSTTYSSAKTIKAKYPAPDFSLISSPAGKISVIPTSRNVDGYEIYTSFSAKGTFDLAKTITSGRAIFIHPTGKTVYYKVRSFVTVAGVKQYSPFSVVKSVVAQ